MVDLKFAATINTHTDGIWISELRELDIVKQLTQQLTAAGFTPLVQNNNNFGYPYIYSRGTMQVNCRLVDSVFFTDANSWHNASTVTVTDNYPLQPMAGPLILALPEFWSIWHFKPAYINRPATLGYNCFMNRPRGDRSVVFYELIKRNILNQGIVSYNCTGEELEQQFINADLQQYQEIHNVGRELLPYNTVQTHGTLEQCIVDSNVSLVLETYTSDSHIVFSEKIFRALQLPRPWLLYCSPGSVALLKSYGFDVLDDYVDVSYDDIVVHGARLQTILDQLETFINRKYTKQDYERFAQAALHNQTLLTIFAHKWPTKFDEILNRIKEL
jgi:hypothetical protein